MFIAEIGRAKESTPYWNKCICTICSDSRMMYWTDWGTTPKIARGRLNDYNVDTIVTGRLKWPNGLVIDAASQKLFWADAGMDKIEYSNLDVRLRACWQWCANGCNNSQQCWDLQCIVGRIQPISLCKPCVMSVRGPNNVRRAVQTDPTLLRYASAITEQKKCWELLAEKFDRFQTLRNNIQQLVQHGVQTDATCSIQQCWE